MVHLKAVTDDPDKIKMAHPNTWHTPWKISENFWESHTHRNATHTQGGRAGGVMEVTVLWWSKLTNKITPNHNPRLFCKSQRKPKKMQPSDVVRITENV